MTFMSSRLNRRRLARRQVGEGVYGGIILTPVTPSSSATQLNPLGVDDPSTTTSNSNKASSISVSSTRVTTSSSPTHASTSAVTSHTSATSAVNTPILSVPAAAVSSATTSSAPQSFLQNPALEGGIFALVGIAALAIIFTVVACIIRTRRRKRVTQTVSFAPNVTERYGGAKPQGASFNERRLSQSASADHVSHFGPPSAFVSKSFSPQSYQAFAVGQETPSTPHSPITPHGSPNSQSSCSGPSERSGGASLTRKLSDRKPVPPLLPGISESHRLTLPPHLHATDHPRPKVPRILPEPEQGPEQKQNFPRSLESISPAAAPETHGTPPGLSKLETAPDE